MPDVEAQIRRYAKHGVDTVVPVSADEVVEASGRAQLGRRRWRPRVVVAVVVATLVAVGLVASLVVLRDRPGGIEIVGDDHQQTPVSVREWTQPQPGWALVVGSVEPTDERAHSGQAAEIQLWDLQRRAQQGTIRAGLSPEAAVSPDQHLYLLSNRAAGKQLHTYLSAVDLQTGDVRWSRRLPEVWQRRGPITAHHLTASSDGSLLLGARGLELTTYRTGSGDQLHSTDLDGTCTRSVRDVEPSWDSHAFLVLCGDQLLEYDPARGSVEELTAGFCDLLPEYEQRRGFPTSGGPLGAAASMVTHLDSKSVTILTLDGRVIQVALDGETMRMSGPSDPLIADAASTQVPPVATSHGNVAVPVVGTEFCEPCAGRGGADHLVVYDPVTMQILEGRRHQAGLWALASSPERDSLYAVDATQFDVIAQDATSLQPTGQMQLEMERVTQLLLIP